MSLSTVAVSVSDVLSLRERRVHHNAVEVTEIGRVERGEVRDDDAVVEVRRQRPGERRVDFDCPYQKLLSGEILESFPTPR